MTHAEASTRRRSSAWPSCRCPSSPPSTGTRSAAAPSWRTPPTSASRRRALKIGNPETGLGIIAAAGASWRLREIVGEARAAELLLTGRTVGAAEALEIGLVSELHPADELLPAAHAIADRIGRNDRAATIATKRVMRAPRSAHPAVDLDEQAVLFESPEKMRRMTEFLERKHKK